MAELVDTVDRGERSRDLREQLNEMRRQQREEQIGRRNALKGQIDEMKSLQKDEQAARKKAIQDQIDELKRLHDEQQASQRAVIEKINELKQLDREERTRERKGLRQQIAEKMGQARMEHAGMRGVAAGPEFMFIQGDPETRKGFLKVHILLALSMRPAHGYELMHWIAHHTGHAWTPSPGSMYPALDSLETKGFIACQGDGRRKVYSLTPKGQDVLVQMRKKQMEQFTEMKAFMASLIDE